MNHHLYTLANGIIGTWAGVIGLITSFQEQLDGWVRTATGIGTLIVVILTIRNLLKNKQKP